MSTLMRILVMFLVWLAFTAVTFYTCVQPQCCGDADVITNTDETTPAEVTNNYAVVSSLGSADVLTGTEWPALRQRLLDQYNANPNQLLEIYGHYYPSEAVPDGYENMGFLRADRIKDLLVPDIPADKIVTLARRMDGATPAAEDKWQAGTFNMSEPQREDEPDKAEIVELDQNEIIVRFPFGSATNSLDQEVEDYLEKLADRLKATEENVTIIGHTDSRSSAEFNMRLGQRRADFLKDVLVRNGAPADRITTESEGETNPVATNDTDSGRQLNRRAVVKLIP
ncbi:OmpA family protein [Lewinella sp. W8]|uniref:OmpA family protein n=1 Tax=Lewinella sp. W8 TaxID=2528208 RepID=UPI00106764EC|nr:OmpA family protein [Lewinella sp. W8]MTB52912.1 OmpA family protein [Lewinella sp. W8]